MGVTREKDWGLLMRLNEKQSSSIKGILETELGASSKVWLFGSRVDDSKRGGDIDIYVETNTPCRLTDKLRLMTKIQKAVGVRKIDLLVNYAGSEHKSIYDIAKREGEQL